MKKYSQDTIDLFIMLWKSGKTYQKISEITKHDRKVISRYIRKLYPNAKRNPNNGNVINQKFNRLTIKGEGDKDKWGGRTVKCLCDCGNVITTSLNKLRQNKVLSCGCYHKDIIRSKQPWEVEFKRYSKWSAAKRGLEFKLTLDEFKEICQRPCFYCGGKPTTKMNVGGFLRNGIDRLDGKNGYILSNSVACCTTCNYMKRTLNQEEFYQHIRKIILNHKNDIIVDLKE